MPHSLSDSLYLWTQSTFSRNLFSRRLNNGHERQRLAKVVDWKRRGGLGRLFIMAWAGVLYLNTLATANSAGAALRLAFSHCPVGFLLISGHIHD